MLLTQIQDKIYQWAYDQLNLVPGGPRVIWSHTNAPRPAFPYVLLHLISMVRMGGDYIGKPDALGKAKIISNHYLNINVSCFYDTDGSRIDAINILDNLRLSLKKETVIKYLSDNYISLTKEVNSILNLPEVIATGFEQRATMDIQFGIATYIEDDVGLIENITGLGTVYNQVHEELPIILNITSGD